MIKTERSALISEDTRPRYAFESSIAQRRKRQLRQFQICLSTIICFAVIIVLVTTAISLTAPQTNVTNVNNESDLMPSIDNFLILPGILECNHTLERRYNDSFYNKAVNSVENDLEYLWKLEKSMPKLSVNTPSYRHQMTTATTNKSNELASLGFLEEVAAKIYYKKYMKYRSLDGICNNLKNPFDYGVTYKPFRRILPPDYSDGISRPRCSHDGKELPSARTISNVIHRPYFRKDPNFSVMLAVWGQFLDHDITSTASSRNKDGTVISCCDTIIKHPECFPVRLSKEDPYYSLQNVTCMNFVRSAPAPNCCLGPREQMNQVTAYIDGSVVYGSSLDVAMNLRTLSGGLLKMFKTADNRQLLPISNDTGDGCNRKEQNKLGRYCFMSGDGRANENLYLTSMHLIWARQHNNLAKRLSKINKHWDDEQIFQETRKILAAQMQHITYNEFLKIILGKNLMRQHDLTPKKSGYYRGYDPNLDASVANSFASSAFRFAHSLIPTLVHFVTHDINNSDYLKLHDILFDPYLLYGSGELDRIIKGAMYTEIQANDAYFTPEVKQHLFERINENASAPNVCGLDLVSLNIQRGRDHGLPGYISWRALCKLSKPQTFDDLSKDIDAETLNYIKSIYRYVEDIDLYTGSLSEKPVNDSMLGPTLNCLLVDQFVRSKRGDRYWYENKDVFTLDQLREIRKTSLADILCENSDNVTQIRPLVMEQNGIKNNDVQCSSLQKMNLTLWSEKHYPRISFSNQDMAIGYGRTYGNAQQYGLK